MFYFGKYDSANGDPLWEKYIDYNPDFDDSISSIALDHEGNLIVLGYVTPTSRTRRRYSLFLPVILPASPHSTVPQNSKSRVV
jgi:hypothetical protein